MDAGETTVGTADSYEEGRSEAILGELINDVIPRSDLVIVLKADVGHRNGRRMVDTSRRAMLAGLDATLARAATLCEIPLVANQVEY